MARALLPIAVAGAWFFGMTATLFVFADRDDISDGFGRGVVGTVTRDCADIPATAHLSQGSFEESRDGKRTRAFFIFFDPANLPSGDAPVLVLYDGERPTG
jgi:hypothetical protein